MDADRSRWNQRWTGRSEQDVMSPPDVLRAHPHFVDRIPTSGAALDLACGLGAQSLWLADRGLDVTALDVSDVAIEHVRSAAVGAGLSLTATVYDTDDGLPVGLDGLAAIVCQRFRVPALYPIFVERLASGGVLVLTVLSAVGLEGTAGDFHASPRELHDAFSASGIAEQVEIVVDEERDGQASIVLVKR